MTDLKNLLHTNSVFASLFPSDLSEVARLASSRSYNKNEKVILYGEVWPYLFLVESGRVDAVKESGEGRSLMVATFSAGDLFWGLAFF
ncbi:MAG: cyclic nucleotide-binding domain-containing protein, partial [Chloroflexota bacterium]